MKKILITGANSYIGTSFEKYIKDFDGYCVDTVDMIDGSWREKNFSQYDIVFHVAGIAHSDVTRASEETKRLYYSVNTDLTVETAKKAKTDGVKQFVFMSSIIVFGSKNTKITRDTLPCPDNFYGDSKLKADESIQKLNDKSFKVVSLRPPMIYGKGSKGNYPLLAKFARVCPLFADYPNCRSMLYIENLCEFIRVIIDNDESGYFYPQNREYVKTSGLVKCIAKVHGKNILMIKLFNFIIKKVLLKINLFKKIFGDMYYDKQLSDYNGFSYCVADFEESIRRTEA